MRTTVKGKNFEVPDAERRYMEQKLRRLERLLDDRSDATVELSVERHRSAADSHIVELTLIVDGQPLRGEAHAVNHRAAADEVLDKLERQVVDLKERPRVRHRLPEQKALLRGIADGTAGGGEAERRAPEVVKVKRFAIEPMFEEDAVARMEDLGHNFFIFVNAENERVCVLYRRTDGKYGLIEPAIASAPPRHRAGRDTQP